MCLLFQYIFKFNWLKRAMPSASRPQVNNYSHLEENGQNDGGQRKSPLVKPPNSPSFEAERSRSFVDDLDEDDEPLQIEIPNRTEEKQKPVTWASLPRKSQLAILVLARLSEPLVQSSLRVSRPYPFSRYLFLHFTVIHFLPTQVF